MGHITELVLCPNKEPFLVAPSTPQAGAGTAKESRSFGLRKSKQPFRHPSKNLKLCIRPLSPTNRGQKSPEECRRLNIPGPTPWGRSF